MIHKLLTFIVTLSMKVIIPYAILVFGVACEAFSSRHSGRPACKTPGEIGRKFPNFEDYGYFWECTELNKDAKCYKCLMGDGYNSRLMTCVHWNNWRYYPLEDPPSLSDSDEEVHCEVYRYWRAEL